MSDPDPNTNWCFFAGTLTVSAHVVIDDAEAFAQLIAGSVPVRCEHLFSEDSFEMTLFNPRLFPKRKEGDRAPRYRVVYDEDIVKGNSCWPEKLLLIPEGSIHSRKVVFQRVDGKRFADKDYKKPLG